MDARAEEAATGPRLIKRYANRKLYDTRDSRYVTLQQIAEFVRRGDDVQIIDNKSKEDLTNVTLAQIIYEEEKKGGEGRGKSLKSFIQEGRDRLVGSLPAPLSKLLREDEVEGEGAAEAAAVEPGAAEGGEKAEAKDERPANKTVSPKEVVEELRGLADDRLKSIVAAAVGSYQELQGEVRRLQKRIEELESRLSSFVGRKESEKGAESKADAKAAESKAAESKAAESGDTDAAADEEG